MAAEQVRHTVQTLAYQEASALIREYTRSLAPTRAALSVGLLASMGRVLAEPVLADREQPPFRRATRDGFACRAADASPQAWLEVSGLLKAGERWDGELAKGQALEIMTGAPLPVGADCVVMVEHVKQEAARVRLQAGRSIKAGDNFIPAGAEASAGATLVAAGTRIGPSHIAAAASVGASRLRVHAAPRVAILSTGDELVELDEQPLLHQIRNSNSYSLAAQVLALGAEPLIHPVAQDSEDALDHSVRTAMSDGCDLLLLSGGVSMGKYDLVEGVLAALGARFFFTGVRIQPGKPLVFGEMPSAGPARLPFFGLPGNPVSTMVTFSLFAAPVLAALGGESAYSPRFAQARLAQAVERKAGLRRFLPALLIADADGAEVRPVPWQGSGDIAGTAAANCLIVVPESEGTMSPGTAVSVLLLH